MITCGGLVSILLFLTVDEAEKLKDALLSVPRLVAQVEQSLLPSRSVLGESEASIGNAQPVVCNEKVVVVAVPAAAITKPSAKNTVPAAVTGLPSPAATNYGANIKFDNVDELAAIKVEVDKSDESGSEDSLIPEDWLEFRYHTLIHLAFVYCSHSMSLFSFSLTTKSVQRRLKINPRSALHYNSFSSEVCSTIVYCFKFVTINSHYHSSNT